MSGVPIEFDVISASDKLPFGFKRLNGIVSKNNVTTFSNANYAIDTGIVLTPNTKIVVNMRCTADVGEMQQGYYDGTNDMFILGVSPSSDSSKIQCWVQLNQRKLFPSVNITDRLTYEVDMATATAKLNNKNTVSFALSTFVYSNLSISLFARHHISLKYIFGSNMELFSARVFNGNTLIADFIPAQNSLGINGLFNLVNKQFYTNVASNLNFDAL